MNMCSNCYKDMILKQEQCKLAASSIENLVNGSSVREKGLIVSSVYVQPDSVEAKCVASSSRESAELEAKEGPKQCSSCHKKGWLNWI
ncbi:zinc finger a20 and an1 domain-containing stress-associated protein 8 [Nicotiana attenuata]|uniref:Zinc finger a20 and an1 domain-containing stress-associated protein 8 n=1 Tax=Nicotiana attenuata TaxID=49451 RepID=A0A1J6I340_NICAT|nr:zinc finger a20 and an1 domain-containing stress-associated protein 8 [Nicotiana attenuata]